MSTPRSWTRAEAERLRAIHSQAEPPGGVSAGSGLIPRSPAPPACPYCDSGDTPRDGQHLLFTDDYDILGAATVPCGKETTDE